MRQLVPEFGDDRLYSARNLIRRVVVIVGVVGSREDDGHAGGDLVKGVVADPPEDVFGFVSRMSEVNDLPVS